MNSIDDLYGVLNQRDIANNHGNPKEKQKQEQQSKEQKRKKDKTIKQAFIVNNTILNRNTIIVINFVHVDVFCFGFDSFLLVCVLFYFTFFGVSFSFVLFCFVVLLFCCFVVLFFCFFFYCFYTVVASQKNNSTSDQHGSTTYKHFMGLFWLCDAV